METSDQWGGAEGSGAAPWLQGGEGAVASGAHVLQHSSLDRGLPYSVGEREVGGAALPTLPKLWDSPDTQPGVGRGREEVSVGIRGRLPKGPPGPAPSPAGRCVATCVSVTRHVPLPSSLPNRCLGPDLDECRVRNLCQHACRNSEGSYRCLCPAGYRLLPSGKNCQGELLPRCHRAQGRACVSPASSPPSHVREGQG